ncbi:hypothetical protein K1719_018137 [Acacia pycnantha]|nr:hypothetical protein K1719_018137 [Acacia pycnantha]
MVCGSASVVYPPGGENILNHSPSHDQDFDLVNRPIIYKSKSNFHHFFPTSSAFSRHILLIRISLSRRTKEESLNYCDFVSCKLLKKLNISFDLPGKLR